MFNFYLSQFIDTTVFISITYFMICSFTNYYYKSKITLYPGMYTLVIIVFVLSKLFNFNILLSYIPILENYGGFLYTFILVLVNRFEDYINKDLS
jgi:hypothetical protein